LTTKGRGLKRRESDLYEPVRACVETLLAEKGTRFHLEITARRRFSNVLKAEVAQGRDIIFHFLRDAAPDITGFIRGEYLADFVVIEIKDRALKLPDIYQTRKYAELLDARYAVLVSTADIPEELKRLHRMVYSLLSLPAYKTLTLARFDETANAFVDWFPRNPFDELK
jgi:hypothetical protein